MPKRGRAIRREEARRTPAPVASPAPTRTTAPAQPARDVPPSRLDAWLSARWTLPAILALAAILRLAHVLALAGTPFFDRLGLDPLVYDAWAQRIAAGDWIGSRIFYQDPLYPYFLGTLYAVFGRNLMLVYVIQIGFGVGTCWLTAILGRRLFGTAAGNLAALLAALFVPSIFYEAQIEKTFLSVFLFVAFLVLVLDRRLGARVAAGAALALASLTRANLLVFVPLGIITTLFERVGPRYDFRRLPDASGIRQAAAFLAGAILILAPVAVRNHHVEGQWVLTTSQAGQNFYIGNNPLNTTGSYIVPPSIRPDPQFEETDFRAVAETAVGRPLTAAEVSDYWGYEAWKHMRANPGFASMMMFRKLVLFWNDYEVPDNLNMYLIERWSWVLRLPLVGVGLMTALAVLGAVVWFRRKTDVRILVGVTALYCGTVVAFFVFSRYRIQIVPVLVVLAAAAILWLEQQVRAAQWPKLAGGVAVVGLTALFCFQSFEWTDRDKGVAISLNNLGAIYTDMGDPPKAIAAYEEAAQLSPRGVIGAMRILGDWHLREGNLDRAEGYMRQVVTYKPDSVMGWNALVQLYTTRRARGDAVTNQLALALLSANRGAEARAVVEEARAAGTPPSPEVEQRLRAASY